MQRTFLYFAAFTGMAAVFVGAIIVTALCSGARPGVWRIGVGDSQRVGGRRRTGR